MSVISNSSITCHHCQFFFTSSLTILLTPKGKYRFWHVAFPIQGCTWEGLMTSWGILQKAQHRSISTLHHLPRCLSFWTPPPSLSAGGRRSNNQPQGHLRHVFLGASKMNLNSPGKSTEKIFQEWEATAYTMLLGISFYQCLLNNVFSELCSWPLPISHYTWVWWSVTATSYGALESKTRTRFVHPGGTRIWGCSGLWRRAKGDSCLQSLQRKEAWFLPFQTSLVSSSLVLAPGPDSTTARGCHCRHFARWQWILPEDLRHPIKPSHVHSKITPSNVCWEWRTWLKGKRNAIQRFKMQAHNNAELQRDALLEKLRLVCLSKKEIKSSRWMICTNR